MGYTYDARRDRLRRKPLLRGWMHLIWFELSLVAGTLLAVAAPADRRPVTVVYVVALSGLLGTSALYHRGNWAPAAHRRLQRLDHAMIFLLIAGTATPIFAVTLAGRVRIALLAAVWSLTLAALLVHLAWMHAPELLVGSTFVALGCIGAVALPAVWVHVGVGVFTLLLGGGVLYILGAGLYHRRWPDPRPDVFGFHEVFHCLVCAAASVQFVAVALVIT